LHLLHKKCSSPLKYERYCQGCGTDVEWEDIVHGYEYEKGKFVVLTDEELHSIHHERTRIMNILRFIDTREVDPLLYDNAYYLEPDEGGERAYILLRALLGEKGRSALVKIVLKEKEHMGILRVFRNALTLQTLHFMDEIAMPEVLHISEDVKLESKEYELGKELVRHFTGRFDESELHDESRESLMELIKTKIEGGEIKVTPEKEVKKVVNLMDALKRSLKEKLPERRSRKGL